MIGKIVAAAIGSKIAQGTPHLGRPGGAALGIVTTSVLRRLGPLGIAALAGGWLLSRERDKRARQSASARRD
ncbi:DUF6203 family protein [Novosphingobium sp. KA1]|uniref:DUF6203 family protein n=1 Tax=Novosphingobium sp. (strain KA1) TaxID=164608 RepID=UPI001A9003DF|nr:DUF6203 family protein [Novosphingobium sp. KA1]